MYMYIFMHCLCVYIYVYMHMYREKKICKQITPVFSTIVYVFYVNYKYIYIFYKTRKAKNVIIFI
uniref:Uncharacterized protein n=1 Tax=Octopus bimaculoides TaxID=37653 RepID=A0A0L8IEZ6_OCTBM